jgi:hypothetical protein
MPGRSRQLLIVLAELCRGASLEISFSAPRDDLRAARRNSTNARMIAMLTVTALLLRRTPDSIAMPRSVNT